MATEILLNYLLRDDVTLAHALRLYPDLKMLKRWMQFELEISENPPKELAKLLLQSYLGDIKWDVVLTFLEVRKELGVRHVC